MNAAPTPQADAAVADQITPPPPPDHWWQWVYAGNALYAWIGAVALAMAVYFGLALVRTLLVTRLKNIVTRTATRVDDLVLAILADVRSWFFLASAIYAGAAVLVIPSAAARACKVLFIVAAVAQALLSSRLAVDFGIRLVVERHKDSDSETDRSIASASGIIRFLAMFVLGCVLILLALSNMGVQITPLLTGLGVGGVAVALAAQSLLSDIFGSLTIVFDKPFLVGDFIVVGQQQGTVEHIGIKTTRVRALSGEQLVFANSDLLGSRIQNFKRMQQRRASGVLEVVYETPTGKLERIAGMIRESIIDIGGDKIRFDSTFFKSISVRSFEFEYVYYVLSAEYNVYMDIQQRINLDVLRKFREAGIDTVHPAPVPAQALTPAIAVPSKLLQVLGTAPSAAASTPTPGTPTTESLVERTPDPPSARE